jgi:hypothetical protein
MSNIPGVTPTPPVPTIVSDPENPHIHFVSTPTTEFTVVADPENPGQCTVSGDNWFTFEGMAALAAALQVGKKYPWCDAWPCDCGERAITNQRCEWPCECVEVPGGHLRRDDLPKRKCSCARVGQWGGCSWCEGHSNLSRIQRASDQPPSVA